MTDPITILVAEDDPDDRLLIKEALEDARVANSINFVRDGEELMDYLLARNDYADRDSSVRPGLILLDLNMPRKDGREALMEIKGNPDLRAIPVVVLTTSQEEEDIVRSYDLGVNSYVAKPPSFTELEQVVRSLTSYWFQIVQLPPNA